MNIGNNTCSHCPILHKTIHHIFLHYIHLQFCLYCLACKLDSQLQANILTQASNFLEILDFGLKKNPLSTSCMAITYTACWELWIAHNNFIFNATPVHALVTAIIERAIDTLTVVHCITPIGKNNHRIRKALDKLHTFSKTHNSEVDFDK